MRKSTLFLTLSVATLSACGPTINQGAIREADGSNVQVVRFQNASNTEEFRLTSTEGWNCVGKVVWPLRGIRPSADATVPVSCDDATTGTMRIEYASRMRSDTIRAPVAISYTLGNGATGSVRI